MILEEGVEEDEEGLGKPLGSGTKEEKEEDGKDEDEGEDEDDDEDEDEEGDAGADCDEFPTNDNLSADEVSPFVCNLELRMRSKRIEAICRIFSREKSMGIDSMKTKISSDGRVSKVG